MTMVHSRNSSKTLKCPKCNWHYKYQETLEIHMKEKHPESEETCPYCLTGQAHPRLARGEVYSCESMLHLSITPCISCYFHCDFVNSLPFLHGF